jgi:hypothetical protein
MDDIPIVNWDDLLTKVYDIPKDFYHRHRSNFVYRGLADEHWRLETSLKRLGGAFDKVEKPLLRSFRKYAKPGSIPSDSLWFRLAVAQHHGLPTRVLDWTTSPRVALHFATAEEDHYDKDGVIWCVDVTEVRSLLPKKLHDVLQREYAWLFSVEMLDFMQSLEEFDRLAEKHDPFVLFFEPPSLDERIVNQAAMMSVMPGADLVFSEFLEAHPKIYYRVVIPKELKWEIRDKLDQDNVTERMLFPGLDGLSRWLKRYYGPGDSKLRPPNDPSIRRIP